MGALARLGLEGKVTAVKPEYSATQSQTRDSFGYQWHRRDSYEAPEVQAFSRKWLMERYCGNDPARLEGYLAGGRKLIMDAGCGAGFSALVLFGDHLKDHDYLGVDISNAVEVAAQRFKEKGYPGDFIQSSLMDVPVPDQSLDIIFSEGVLHHTDSTERALVRLSTKLKPGGRFLFYVYAKKPVIREFTDDHIRQALQGLSNEEAWKALIPLTRLGEALGKLGVELDVPEDIPYLGIKKGKQDLQRFFYWNVCKAFYQPGWGIEEQNHLNFDWFRPLNCFRHTPEEVRGFCEHAGLSIEDMDIQEAGITVIAVKR